MQLSRKMVAIVAIGVAALLVVYELYTLNGVPGDVNSPVPHTFAVNGRSYVFTYLATTESERAAGLMNRKISNTTTMLFAFPSFGRWSFWMYDTNTSLDMIWVNGTSGRVVSVVAAAQPCYNTGGIGCKTYTPTLAANYVIEAKAGFAAANGIEVGTVISFGGYGV